MDGEGGRLLNTVEAGRQKYVEGVVAISPQTEDAQAPELSPDVQFLHSVDGVRTGGTFVLCHRTQAKTEAV